jgi:pimeloyl-ACP methyl ester carboxylesterase
MREEALLFGSTKSLVGILTLPPDVASSTRLPAVIFLNAGLVHRVGPHRLYTTMARDLAAMGFVVLRFDFSGIGDSNVRDDHLPFDKSAVSETQEAMNWLSAAKGSERFVLIGLCSGARVALRTACSDPRVVGAVLINAQGGKSSARTYLGRVARYYTRYSWKVFLPITWLKIVTGEIDVRGLSTAVGFQLGVLLGRKGQQADGAPDTAAALRRLLIARGVRLLLVYAKGDLGLDYLEEILGDELHQLRVCGNVQLEIISGSNHLFTLLWTQEYLLKIVHQWAQAMMQN